MREKPKNATIIHSVYELYIKLQSSGSVPSGFWEMLNWEAVDKILWMGVPSDVVRGAHHVTRHNTPIHNILSTDSQLSISQKALETLPEDGNLMPKHVGATIHSS
jgi:hypothetical protein